MRSVLAVAVVSLLVVVFCGYRLWRNASVRRQSVWLQHVYKTSPATYRAALRMARVKPGGLTKENVESVLRESLSK